MQIICSVIPIEKEGEARTNQRSEKFGGASMEGLHRSNEPAILIITLITGKRYMKYTLAEAARIIYRLQECISVDNDNAIS